MKRKNKVFRYDLLTFIFKSYILLIALSTLLQYITSPILAQSFSNCQHSSTHPPQPVGDSPVTWATLLYRLRQLTKEFSGRLSNVKPSELGISFLYLDLSNRAQIRIELVGSTAQRLIAADCWNDRLKEITIDIYHVSSNQKLTWQDLEDPVLGDLVFEAIALLAARHLVPNQLGELEYRHRYLENLRNRARSINTETAYLSLGITDNFCLFSTEYARGELIFWVYYRQKLLVQ